MAKRRSEQGVRSYGPGKFNTVIDSLVYTRVLDGFADEMIEVDGDQYDVVEGGPSLLDFVDSEATERGDKLTADERTFLQNAAGVIFFERSDGIVEAAWFHDEKTFSKSVRDLENAGEASYV